MYNICQVISKKNNPTLGKDKQKKGKEQTMLKDWRS